MERCDPGSERELAWTLVRSVIGDAPVERSELGKPYLPETPGKYISLSHVRGYAAAAVADSRVGIDVELLSRIARLRDIGRFAQIVLAEGERADSAVELLEYWTKKEAYGKLDGRGLSIGLRSMQVDKLDSVRFHRVFTDGEALCVAAVEEEVHGRN
ncbi:MAG: 4'-phosphopantetheinyl transferase superfamily protein [Oscillospiraceae bacterium]|nr:4'-phosphopantetheinyl transferase superfamily protein [Oscillospiraceae bacterium]